MGYFPFVDFGFQIADWRFRIFGDSYLRLTALMWLMAARSRLSRCRRNSRRRLEAATASADFGIRISDCRLHKMEGGLASGAHAPDTADDGWSHGMLRESRLG